MVLPVIFNKYQLDYGFFQNQVIDRLTKRVQVLQLLPAIAKLPEAQIDRLFQVGYQEVAEDLKLKINEKLKLLTAQNRGHKEMARVPFGHHTVKITGINTASIFEKNSYFTDYIEESISEDELVNQIAANIDIIVTYGALTPGEVWKCFKEAVGFGGSSMLGVVGWSRLAAML